jgi:hypothetical protein
LKGYGTIKIIQQVLWFNAICNYKVLSAFTESKEYLLLTVPKIPKWGRGRRRNKRREIQKKERVEYFGICSVSVGGGKEDMKVSF